MNSAGQGHAWASAVERNLAGVAAANVTVMMDSTYAFPSEFTVSADVYRNSRRWSRAERSRLRAAYTHGLWESGRHPLGLAPGTTTWEQIRLLHKDGIEPAFVAHGSDVRIPSRHASAHVWSPFRDSRNRLTRSLEARALELHEGLQDFSGRRFVSTPDLLGYVPGSEWLPVVVEREWLDSPPRTAAERPRVGHVTSNSMVKRSNEIELVIEPLVRAGLITYKRMSGRSPREMKGELMDCDIVLDQFGIGAYGVAACEAMAIGCVVIGNVTDEVRRHVREATGLDVPILQAELGTIPEVLRRVIESRDELATLGETGTRFVEEVHDGRFSANVLRSWLMPGGAAGDSPGRSPGLA